MSQVLAFDIGGANIKVADGRDHARSYPFPLWRRPDQLHDQLQRILSRSPPADRIVATMTGELADCFATKREGVVHIIDCLVRVAAGRPVEVYLTDGSLATPDVAKQDYRMAAASNWHALANFARRFTRDADALLIDIGSTTSDVIPLPAGATSIAGRTDTRRLVARELVYSGIERTPVCAVAPALPYRGTSCPIAAEFFASMLDVYLILGDLAERPRDHDTADGRPATRPLAVNRLGRCLCADHDEYDAEDALAAATYLAQRQSDALGEAIRRVTRQNGLRRPTVILSGHGDFLFQRALGSLPEQPGRVIRLADEIGAAPARCAPAWALAKIASR